MGFWVRVKQSPERGGRIFLHVWPCCLNYMSPLQGFYKTDDFPHGSRHGLQPVTPFGVKASRSLGALARAINIASRYQRWLELSVGRSGPFQGLAYCNFWQ